MTDPFEIPIQISCAECTKPINCLNSYGITPPIDAKVKPSDFCGLLCLATWAARNASEGGA